MNFEMECEIMAKRRKYDHDGYDENGFNRKGIHRNGTRYDDEGYDRDGYDEDGYGRDGHNKNGYDRLGFDRNGIHRISLSKYYNGYDKERYNKDGYNWRGFNKMGLHRNGTYYDKEGYDKDGYNKDGYNELGYDKNGFDEAGIHKNGTLYDEKGFSKYDISKEGINRNTGKLDERVELVKKYLEAGISKVAFCQKNKMKVEDFNLILKIVSQSYPTITKVQIDEVAQKSANRYYQTLKKIAHDLENDEISIEDFTRTRFGFDEISRVLSSFEAKTAIRQKIFEYMVSGKMNMMQYFSVFGLGRSSTFSFKEAMNEYNQWLSIAKKNPEFKQFVPKLYNERKRIGKYERPYSGCQGLKIGYKDAATEKDILVEMTREHEKYAKEFLYKTGEYICESTMHSVFQQFVRGTLTFDDVEIAEDRGYHDDGISVDDDLSETLREAIDDVRAKQSELSLVREERETLESIITTEKTSGIGQEKRINNRKRDTHSKSPSEDMELK